MCEMFGYTEEERSHQEKLDEIPLQAVRRLLPGCRHTLRARAGQAVISPLSRENLSELTSDDEG
jgi:hypothetical protein